MEPWLFNLPLFIKRNEADRNKVKFHLQFIDITRVYYKIYNLLKDGLKQAFSRILQTPHLAL